MKFQVDPLAYPIVHYLTWAWHYSAPDYLLHKLCLPPYKSFSHIIPCLLPPNLEYRIGQFSDVLSKYDIEICKPWETNLQKGPRFWDICHFVPSNVRHSAKMSKGWALFLFAKIIIFMNLPISEVSFFGLP